MVVQYKTFIPYEDKKLTLKTVNLINQIYLSDDPLHKNYSESRFDLDNQLAVTLGFIEEEPVYLSTLYQRNNYLPGIARTMNRVWKHPKLRAPSFGKYIKNSDITSLAVVPMHIPYAIQNNIDTIFISIEGKAHRYMNFLSRKLTEKTGTNWHIVLEQIDVTGTKSMQHVIYCNLNPSFFSQSCKKQKLFSVV